MRKGEHVHFMGIGGSGLAATSLIAKAYGFRVSGCDLSPSSYYTDALLREGIRPQRGHDAKHLEGIDILAVSPAIFDINPNHPEVVEAKKRGILMTWQEFMGKYLQKGKFVIAVAGTHGKSTTTALMGLALTAGGLDPTVEVGALVPTWRSNFRVGDSKYFICEADQ
jgi:UDP-N-acetylmuramate--alanine ligase